MLSTILNNLIYDFTMHLIFLDMDKQDATKDLALQHALDTADWFESLPACYFNPTEPFDESISF